MGKYIHYTKEEIEKANQIDLATYLRRNGHPLKKQGKEYCLDSTSGKVGIWKNRWYHYYEQVGGYAIAFFMYFYQLSFLEAMEKILQEEGLEMKEVCSLPKEKLLIPPEPHENTSRIQVYLTQRRCIREEVFWYFVKEKMIYESRKYHNVVFVGKDKGGVIKYVHCRGIGKSNQFKQNVAGSDLDYGFCYVGTSSQVYVFEAPIDLLSFISIHFKDWKQHSYVALCSVSERALMRLLKEHEYIQEVHMCLDNDKAGKEAFQRIKKHLETFGAYKVYEKFPRNKDWNEDLQQMKKQEEGEIQCQEPQQL